MFITPKFEKLFNEYPLFSQAWDIDHIVIAKLEAKNRILLLLEYSSNNKTAFWYLKKDENEWILWYVYLPDLNGYTQDDNFKLISLQKIVNIKQIINSLKDR